MIRRVHVGCGLRNPFVIPMWAAFVVGWASLPVNIALHTFWGFLFWLPWLAVVVLLFRWERVHSPAKMYRTWLP